MPAAEEWHEGPLKTSFFTKRWQPVGETRASIIAAHGFMENLQRYDEQFDRLMLAGYSVFAFDQRGFGKTAQKTDTQGITSWPKALTDLDYFVNREADLNPNRPLFLFGHSMGGALCIAAATRIPALKSISRIKGIIASAPLIEQTPAVKANGLVVRAGSILGSVLPSLQLKVGVPSNDICRDPDVCKAYAADPLCPPIGSYRGVADMLLGGQKLIREVSRWPADLPVYIYHGTADKVTSFDATKKAFDNLPKTVKDKTFKAYEGYYHELHNEPNDLKWAVIKDIEDWINARI